MLPGRSAAPWLIGIAGLVVVVLAAVALWFVLDDRGESDREAYCASLTDVTDDGDLAGALGTADERTLDEVEQVAAVAPDVVADDWETLAEVARTRQRWPTVATWAPWSRCSPPSRRSRAMRGTSAGWSSSSRCPDGDVIRNVVVVRTAPDQQ